jgi:hypothetical protein
MGDPTRGLLVHREPLFWSSAACILRLKALTDSKECLNVLEAGMQLLLDVFLFKGKAV